MMRPSQASYVALRITVLTDDAFAGFRRQARRCGVFPIAQRLRKAGWPLEMAVQALAHKGRA